MKNKDKYVIGIIGAALAGIAVGLLCYTDEGKKAQKKIKNAAADWADSLGSLIATGKENLTDLSDKAKEGYKKVKNKTEDKYHEIKDNLSKQADDYANKIN